MNVRQFEVWKAKPEGFQNDHWFIIISNTERGQSPQVTRVNGLACFTLRGHAKLADVLLDSSDGFASPTVCACDYLHGLDKAKLHSPLGAVSWERQQQIKSKIKELFRL
jgi:hypothetical protein